MSIYKEDSDTSAAPFIMSLWAWSPEFLTNSSKYPPYLDLFHATPLWMTSSLLSKGSSTLGFKINALKFPPYPADNTKEYSNHEPENQRNLNMVGKQKRGEFHRVQYTLYLTSALFRWSDKFSPTIVEKQYQMDAKIKSSLDFGSSFDK